MPKTGKTIGKKKNDKVKRSIADLYGLFFYHLICFPHGFLHEIHDFPRKVLELFAGIGGWRLALAAAEPDRTPERVAAYDSGPHCSEAGASGN